MIISRGKPLDRGGSRDLIQVPRLAPDEVLSITGKRAGSLLTELRSEQDDTAPVDQSIAAYQYTGGTMVAARARF